MAERGEITGLLAGLTQGNPDALEQLVPIVYEELRRVARQRLRGEAAWHTLATTDLVHETFFRLVDLDRIDWKGRAHFFALASRLMRQILVNRGEKRRAEKRGGGRPVLPLAEAIDQPGSEPGPGGLSLETALALDRALERLERMSERQCRVVEFRFFAGLNIEETAEVLEVSPATVKRDWALARAWLNRELTA